MPWRMMNVTISIEAPGLRNFIVLLSPKVDVVC